jgi:hypothetical protein
MNLLNDGKTAWIFPPRCGTRYTTGHLNNLNLREGNKAATHDCNWSVADGRTIFLNVRNPFTRVRSIYRWMKEINKIQFEEVSFQDFFVHRQPVYFNTITDHINRKVDRIDHIIHLECIGDDLEAIGWQRPEFKNNYHMQDDGIDDLDAYTPKLIDYVVEHYKDDFENFGYSTDPEKMKTYK